jgi:hypothetical protein
VQLTTVADVLSLALKSVPEKDRGSDAPAALRDLYTGVDMTERELMKVRVCAGCLGDTQRETRASPFGWVRSGACAWSACRGRCGCSGG